MADSNRSPDKTQSAEDYLSTSQARWTPGRPPLLGRTTSSSAYGPGRPPKQPLSPVADPASSPRTPLLTRTFSSAFNSPSTIFRTDDEVFVFEFGARFLRIGLGGESHPRCALDFGPATQKRAGDYSSWLPETAAPTSRRIESYEDWGRDYELWRLEAHNADLSLVADKLERSIRTAMSEYVLVQDDTRKRFFNVVLPPDLSHPLISTILTTLFNTFPPPPAISLLSSPILCAVAAGIRSALVIDIGWAETVITPVYEYRELRSSRSYRGMKMCSWETARLISRELHTSEDHPTVSFADVEEILYRTVHIPSRPSSKPVTIPITSLNTTITLPFSSFSQPAESTFLSSSTAPSTSYDPAPSLPATVYTTLLHLAPDIRAALLPHIIFTGGGASLPGLKPRIFAHLTAIIADRGWDPTHNYGSAKTPLHPNPARTTTFSLPHRPSSSAPAKHSPDAPAPSNKDLNPLSTTPAFAQPQLPDPVLASLQRRAAPSSRAVPSDDATETPTISVQTQQHQPQSPSIRAVKSQGAWAGASLLAGLRIKAAAEVERERFLAHGLVGCAVGGATDDSVVAPPAAAAMDGAADRGGEDGGRRRGGVRRPVSGLVAAREGREKVGGGLGVFG